MCIFIANVTLKHLKGSYMFVMLFVSEVAVYAATSLTNNDMCMILIHDFNKEQHELPEDDKQCAIETCRSLLSVLV
jgi:hypothetical protein